MDHTKAILTLTQAKSYIESLHKNGIVFHFEDDPMEIVHFTRADHRASQRTFTDDEAKAIRKRMKELYKQNWKSIGYECPIGYALKLEGHKYE